MLARLPDAENERLAALRDHQILDTPPEEEFDGLVRLAAHVCGVPIAAVTLIDEHRQWFKAVTGVSVTEVPRDIAFCAHTILQPEVLVVQDTQTDPRFADNPLVTGEHHVRFYAGAPLVTEDGYALGSLCVIDRTPRSLTREQEEALRLLAGQAASQFRAKLRVRQQERLMAERERMVSARERVEAALGTEREFTRALLESLQEGIIACDADGTLTLFNRATREFYGLPEQLLPTEPLGEYFEAFHADGLTPMRAEDAPLLRALQNESVRDVEMVIAPKSGPLRTLVASGQAIHGTDGERLGAVVAMHDVTDRRQAERELARLAAIVESSEEAIIAGTMDGTIVSWNQGAERLYGYSASDMVGQHSSVLAQAQEKRLGPGIVARLMRGEAVEPMEVVRTRKDGSTVDVSLSFSPIRDTSGQMIGVSWLSHDITERKCAETALAESNTRLQENEERLRRLTDAAFEGIAVSQDGVLVDVSTAFAALFGYATPAEMRGLPGAGLAAPESQALVRQKITNCDEERYEATMLRRDGTTFQAELRGRLIQFGGRPARVTAVRDITEYKEMERSLRENNRALEESRTRLAEAQRVAQMGSWEYDIATNTITWSDELFRLFGMDPAQGAPSVEALMGRFHPDDVPMHIAVSNQAMQDGLPYEFDIRAPQSDGSQRWLHAVGRGERDGSGCVTRLFGTLMDITERKVSEERFRVLFEQSSHPHLLFDEDGGIIDCNAATLSLMRCKDKAQMLGTHPALLSPEVQRDGRRSDEKGAEMCALARRDGSHRFEWQRRAMDGCEFPVEVALTPVTLGGRSVLLSVWHNLTERKRQEEEIRDYAVILELQKRELEEANARLEALATTDGLTGLRNHRAFQERLAQEVVRATRYNVPLSVVLLDVDNFKQYNDAHGHPSGDEVLRQVGSILQSCARGADLAARYGGEEFVLILPQTDGEGATAIAERIREAIAQAHWPKRAVTASLGVSSLSLDMDEGGDLIVRADAALYRSKSAGRNRVTYVPCPIRQATR
jgi:diguanylate cyclase (GGDEF)-like protein/PAS domain S-box-containing protein